MNAKRTEPTQTLYQGMKYINAASTDLKARFERMRREQLQQQAPAVALVRRGLK